MVCCHVQTDNCCQSGVLSGTLPIHTGPLRKSPKGGVNDIPSEQRCLTAKSNHFSCGELLSQCIKGHFKCPVLNCLPTATTLACKRIRESDIPEESGQVDHTILSSCGRVHQIQHPWTAKRSLPRIFFGSGRQPLAAMERCLRRHGLTEMDLFITVEERGPCFMGKSNSTGVVPFYPVLGEGSPTKPDKGTKATLILTNLKSTRSLPF